MKKLKMFLAGLLAVSLLVACSDDEGKKKPNNPPTPPEPVTVEAVTFDPAAGEVASGTQVALATATEGATIYYGFAEDAVTTEYDANNKPALTEAVTIYAVAKKGDVSSELTSAAYTIEVPTPVPEDANDIKDGLKDGVTAYWVSDVDGLKKLSEIVNGGNALAGYTFVVKNDIQINKKVIQAKFLEPEEGENCTANASYVNLDSIGMGSEDSPVPFSGTFDGNNKVIDGFYAYQAHQGLAFFGCISGAKIKNVILTNACVINSNASGADDGHDDDRVGGLIGDVVGESSVKGCVFTGVVGSAAAVARGTYEYIGGLVGRADAAIEATNCIVFAKVYGTSAEVADIICKKGADKVKATDVTGIDAATYTEGAYTGDNAYVLAAIALLSKEPVTVADPVITLAEGEYEADTPITITCETTGAFIVYKFGSEPTPEDYIKYATTAPAVTATETIYAVAVIEDDGEYVYSHVVKASYTLQGDTVAPTFTPGAGKVVSGSTVVIETTTPGATIYYGDSTLSKEEYATTGTVYTAPVEITEPKTIYALAVKGSKVSEIASAEYTIAVPPSAVTIGTPAGDLVKGTAVEFTAETGTIYYEFVTSGESALNKTNYADFTEYKGPVAPSASGTYYVIAVNDGLTSEIVNVAYTVVLPTNDISAGLIDGVKSYVVSDVASLNKLAEIVNEGNALSGYTFVVANDITINESVLLDGFLEPAESAIGEPAAGLVNLDSIGKKGKPFSGTFDGNNKVIRGLYIYQGHQGLGFFGSVSAATIKNVVLLDACVVNKNMEAGSQAEQKDSGGTKHKLWWDAEFPETGTIPKLTHDGSDDDRFGGLIGLAEGESSVENFIFSGVVGSDAAANRTANVKDVNGNDYTNNPYEYIGGLVGRADKAVSAKNCTILARVYGSGDVVCSKGTVNKDNVAAYDAKDKLEEGQTAVANAVAAAQGLQ